MRGRIAFIASMAMCIGLAGGACALNPQPLPPDTSGDSGVLAPSDGAATGQDAGFHDADNGGSATKGDSGTADGAPPSQGASDSGREAEPDSMADASSDAGDGGDADSST